MQLCPNYIILFLMTYMETEVTDVTRSSVWAVLCRRISFLKMPKTWIIGAACYFPSKLWFSQSLLSPKSELFKGKYYNLSI